jgi:xylulokinase
MHGTVLVGPDGVPVRPTVPLWNDKRTTSLVAAFEAAHGVEKYLRECANPPTPAWPAFKLAWLRDNDPEAYARTSVVLMPKDFINFRLTAITAMDTGDASLSFLKDPASGNWSPEMADRLGLALVKLPPIRSPLEILGPVTPDAAAQTGLPAGTPVLVGGADYPAALLGSGVSHPGIASDVTGTSCIITLNTRTPILDPEICNVATIEGNWGSFVLLESGGDAVRWARRALHGGKLDYAGIMAEAAEAPAGADGLFFLPFLTGERLGRSRNARAQFFGLAAVHRAAHLDRAVNEGVAFAGTRALRNMERSAGRVVERVVASSGGAKSELWLKIKASAYNIPIVVPEEAECGIVGCSIMAATALGLYSGIDDAVSHCVRYKAEIEPDAAWAERYARMQPIFDTLYERSRPLYDELDELARYVVPLT